MENSLHVFRDSRYFLAAPLEQWTGPAPGALAAIIAIGMRAGLEVRFEGRQLRRVATVEYPHRRPVLTACAGLRGHAANGAVPIASVLGSSIHQASSLLNNERLSHGSLSITSRMSDLAAQDRGEKAVPGFHGTFRTSQF